MFDVQNYAVWAGWSLRFRWVDLFPGFLVGEDDCPHGAGFRRKLDGFVIGGMSVNNDGFAFVIQLEHGSGNCHAGCGTDTEVTVYNDFHGFWSNCPQKIEKNLGNVKYLPSGEGGVLLKDRSKVKF